MQSEGGIATPSAINTSVEVEGVKFQSQSLPK